MRRRHALLALPALAATPARAQPWAPTRPVTFVVPFPPGGATDLCARALQNPVAALLGQPVVVENRPGGNGVIGLEACAVAPPDGVTFCAVNIEAMSTLPHVEPELFARFASLRPVTQLATSPSVLLASMAAPAGDLRDFVAWARATPGLNYGSSGQGSAQQLLWEWIKARDHFAMEHVPFRGIADAIRELTAGRVQASYVALALAVPLVRDGRVRPLAVLGPRRLPELPDTPTMLELGYDFPYSGAWWGLAAPGATPEPIVQAMAAAVRRVVRNEEFQARVLAPQFFNGIGSSPEDFAAMIQRERTNGAEVVRLSGITGAR